MIGLLGLTLFTTRIQTDLSAFIVSGDLAAEKLLAGEMQSGALSRRYLLSVVSPQGESVAPAFGEKFVERLKAVDGVEDVWLAQQNRMTVAAILSIYAGKGANLYSLHPHRDLDTLLTADGLNRRAAMLREVLLTPHAGLIKPIAKADPLLLTIDGFRMLQDRMASPRDRQDYQNIILETRVSGLEVAEQQRIQESIVAAFDAIDPGPLRLEMTGVPIYAVATQSLMQRDIARLSILSSIAISLLFIAIFRSIWALCRIVLILAAVLSSAILITGLVFGSVHGLTMAIGTTLIGVCIDYPIHGLVHAQNVGPALRASRIRTIWPSMMMAGVTTVVGYIALGFSGYPGFQQVAVYSGAGILVSLLLTRWILPLTMAGDRSTPIRIPGVIRWMRFCIRRRQILRGLLVLFLLATVFQLDEMNWISDLQELTPEMAEMKQTDRAIRARMVSIEPGRFILVSGDDTEAALKKAEIVYAELDQLIREGSLQGYFGLYPWILSAERQLQNQRVLRQRLTPEVEKIWQDSLQKHGLSVAKLGTLNYPTTDPVSLTQVLESPLGRLIGQQIIQSEDRTLIMIWISKHSPETLRKQLQDFDEVEYFSQRELLNQMAFRYRDRAQLILMAGLGAILVLLLLRYRSISAVLTTVLPSLLSALIIFSLWCYFSTPVSFLHLIGFVLVVAICVDYGIFYRENRAGEIQITYQAMAASMLTSALAFGVLVFAETSILKMLAGVVSLGVLLGFLFCPLVIRHEAEEV